MDLSKVKDINHLNAFAKNLYTICSEHDKYAFDREVLFQPLERKKLLKKYDHLVDKVSKYLLIEFGINKDDVEQLRFIKMISFYAITLVDIIDEIEVPVLYRNNSSFFREDVRNDFFEFKRNILSLASKSHEKFISVPDYRLSSVSVKYIDSIIWNQMKQISPDIPREDLLMIVKENTTQYNLYYKQLEDWSESEAFVCECNCYDDFRPSQIQKSIKLDFFHLVHKVRHCDASWTSTRTTSFNRSNTQMLITNLYMISLELSKYVAPASWDALDLFSDMKLTYVPNKSIDPDSPGTEGRLRYRRDTTYDVFLKNPAEVAQDFDPSLMPEVGASVELDGIDRHIILFLTSLRFENEKKNIPNEMKSIITIDLKEFAPLFGYNKNKEKIPHKKLMMIKQRLIKLHLFSIRLNRVTEDGEEIDRFLSFIHDPVFRTKDRKAQVSLGVSDSFYKFMCESRIEMNFRDFNTFSLSSEKDIYYAIEKLIVQKSANSFSPLLKAFISEKEISDAAGLSRRALRNVNKIIKVCDKARENPGTFLRKYSLDEDTNTFYFEMNNPITDMPESLIGVTGA